MYKCTFINIYRVKLYILCVYRWELNPYTKCLVISIVRIVWAKPPINIKYDICTLTMGVVSYGYLTYLFWSRCGFFLTVACSRPSITVLQINVFDLYFILFYNCSIHENPKALECPTAVNNQQQSITRVICMYHHRRRCRTHTLVQQRVPQMDRLNSFARVIFGRKQCVSRQIWQTIGPKGDLYRPLNGFLRRTPPSSLLYSYCWYHYQEGNGLNLHVVWQGMEEKKFLLSSGQFFCSRGWRGVLVAGQCVWGEFRCRGRRNMLIREDKTLLLCRGYDELRGRPKDRYWPFVTIKKRYESFLIL